MVVFTPPPTALVPKGLGPGLSPGLVEAMIPRLYPVAPVAAPVGVGSGLAGILVGIGGVGAAFTLGLGLGVGLNLLITWLITELANKEQIVEDKDYIRPTGNYSPSGWNDFAVYIRGEYWPRDGYSFVPGEGFLMNWYSFGPGKRARLPRPVAGEIYGLKLWLNAVTAVIDDSSPGGQQGVRWGEAYTGYWSTGSSLQLLVRPSGGQGPGVPFPVPTLPPVEEPQRLPITPDVPEVFPSPLEVPVPSWPIPAPQVVPLPQDPEPETQPDPTAPPRPSPPPQPLPAPRPSPVPAPARTPSPRVGTGGSPLPEPEPEPSVTPPWQELPWPGGQPIGDPSQRPPEGPTGTAMELGRLEEKLRQIGARSPVVDVADLLGKLLDGLKEPAARFSAGSYQLRPVCDRNERGEILPARSASWLAGEGEIELLNRKIDALAVLLQHHKDLRQPTCGSGARQQQPVGQPVTVTFEEVPGP